MSIGNDVFVAGDKKLVIDKINDNTYVINSYKLPLKERESGKSQIHGLGRFFISHGLDGKGEYYSYYDVFDRGQGKDENTYGIAKSFELYVG